MQPDRIRVSDTREWLLHAREDLETAEDLLALRRRHLESIVFHCQQAAEKALKGFLTWHDCPFEKIRNLEEIGKLCIQIDSALAALMAKAVTLTQYSSRFRYPGAPYELTVEEATAALELAKEVVSEVTVRLPRGVSP